jgi:hypothetical protein
MINQDTLNRITENIPLHFWDTYWNLPKPIKMKWLEKFIKKDLTIDDIYYFLTNKEYYPSLESYEKSDHFLILKDVLKLDLEKYKWLYSQVHKFKKELDRDITIWLIQRD